MFSAELPPSSEVTQNDVCDASYQLMVFLFVLAAIFTGTQIAANCLCAVTK